MCARWSGAAEISEDLRLTESGLKKGHVNVPKYRAMYLDAALKSNQELSVEKPRDSRAWSTYGNDRGQRL